MASPVRNEHVGRTHDKGCNGEHQCGNAVYFHGVLRVVPVDTIKPVLFKLVLTECPDNPYPRQTFPEDPVDGIKLFLHGRKERTGKVDDDADQQGEGGENNDEDQREGWTLGVG